MNVSKVVVVVVALHVLVIGGIFVFEGCSRAKTPDLAQNETAPPMATGDVAQTLPTPIPVPVPASENQLMPASPVPAPVGSAALSPVPAPAPLATVTPAPVTPAASGTTYTVKKGDSLYRIAKNNKITIEQLARANNLSKSSLLQIGQKLNIPATTAPAAPTTVLASAPAAAASAPIAASGNTHEVALGDSLWKIARQNGVSVTELKQANNLTSDRLQVGQKLVVPAKTAPAPAPATTTAAPVSTSAPATPTAPAPNPTAVIAPGISVR